MFTGIVEETGTVKALVRNASGVTLLLDAPICGRGMRKGDSLAVNGCCLTIVRLRKTEVEFDILNETLKRTNLGECTPGSLVNLERPLAARGRFHGHIVSGHIDTAAPIKRFSQMGADWRLEIQPARALLRYVVEKGSIALDGISLTVADVSKSTFTVWIIPHTRAATALRDRQAGALVNLEFDMIAKYVERLLRR